MDLGGFVPIEYDSKAAIRKVTDDEYQLIWNVGMRILSVLTEEQVLEMIESLQRMSALPPGETEIYHFPVMRHTVTG